MGTRRQARWYKAAIAGCYSSPKQLQVRATSWMHLLLVVRHKNHKNKILMGDPMAPYRQLLLCQLLCRHRHPSHQAGAGAGAGAADGSVRTDATPTIRTATTSTTRTATTCTTRTATTCTTRTATMCMYHTATTCMYHPATTFIYRISTSS